jgi:hypothetical protein
MRPPLTPAAPPRSTPALWSACLRGFEPAESLDWRDREELVLLLADHGWSDVQIATHCRMTTYTTHRIRTRGTTHRTDERIDAQVARLLPARGVA